MNQRFFLFFLSAAALLVAPGIANAIELTWDANTTTTGIQEGGGTWVNGDNHWYNGANVAWDNSNPTDAIFGGGSGTVADVYVGNGGVSGGGVTATGINLKKAYNLQPAATNPGIITLVGAPIITTATTASRIYADVHTASDVTLKVLTNSAAGGNKYLYLYGSNTIDGPIEVGSSTATATDVLLMPSAANALGGASTSMITVNAFSTISLRGTAQTINRPFTISGTGSGSRGALNFYANSQNSNIQGNVTLSGDATVQMSFTGGGTGTISGIIGESGGSRVLTVNRSGTQYGELVLTQANAYTGGTKISGVTLTLDSTTPVTQGDYTISGTSTTTYDGRLKINKDNTDLSNSVINFDGTGANAGQFLDLLGHSLTVKGVGNTSGLTPTDFGAVIQNNLAGTTGTLIVNSTADTAYQGSIRDGVGTLAIVKRGTGVWTITGANSAQYTGGLTVENGTLSIYNGKLPTTGLTNISGGTLSLSSGIDTPVGPFRLTSGTLTDYYHSTYYGLVSAANYDVRSGDIRALLKGNVGLDKTGAGTVTLYSPAAYTGPTTIQQGTLKLGHDVDFSLDGSILSPAIEVGASGIFDVSDPAIPTFQVAAGQTLQGFGNVIGNVTVADTSGTAKSYLGAGNATTAGTLTLGNALTAQGGANLEFHLSASATGGNDNINVSGALTLPSGTDKANLVVHCLGASLDTSAPYAVLGYNSLVGTPTAANLSVVNPTRYTITPSLDTVAKKIKLVVSGTTAPLSLTWVGDGSANEWNANRTANWTNGGSQKFFELDTANFGNSSSNTTVNLVEPLHPAAVVVNIDESHNYTFQGLGKITGIGTTLSKSGIGTLTIDNSGVNDFTGDVTISNGKVVLGTNSVTPLGGNAGATNVTSSGSDAGTLDLNGKTLPLGEVVAIAGAGYSNQGALVNNGLASTENTVKNLSLTANATIGGSADWIVGGNSGGLLGGGFTLTKIGFNNVSIDGMGATNLGDIAVNEGRLTFSGNSTLGTTSGTVTLADGTTLATALASVAYQKNLAVNTTAGACTLLADGPGSLTGTATLNGKLTAQVNSDYQFTLGSNMTGAAGLEKTGTGILVLAGNNNYQGDTTISKGQLYLSSTATGSGYYAIPGNLVYGASGGIYVTLKDGEEAGHPQLAPTSTIKFSTTNTDQWLWLENHTATVEGIEGVHATSTSDQAYHIQTHADSGVGTLILDTQLADHAYRGEIIDRGARFAVIKRGPKTQTLMGGRSGDFTGGLTIEEGTLDFFYGTVGDPPVAVPGILPTGNCTITGGTLKMGKLSRDIGESIFKITGGLLQADTAPDTTYTNPARLISSSTFDVQGGTVEARLGGTAGLTKSGPATAVLKGENYYTGITTVANGTLQLGDNTTTGSVAGDIAITAALANLAINRSDDLPAFSNVITGSTGAVTKQNTNKLTLTGPSTFSGVVHVVDGTLALNGGTLGDTVTIDNAMNFMIEDTSPHTVGSITGGGATLVNTGAQLIAASITQGTLTIGGPPAVAVPEPASWLLLLAGLAALFASHIRFSKKG
jgi:fibronectin-binding autotransporter adhesin